MSIAEGTFETSEENAVVADQYLYDLLSSDSVMLQSDPVYESFYVDNMSGTVGQIHEVTSKLKLAYQPEISYLYTLVETDSIWNTYILSIQQVDSLALANPGINYSFQRETLTDQLANLLDTLEGLMSQQRMYSLVFADSAMMLNNNFSPGALPQENEKFINQVNVQLITFGMDSIVNYYNQVLGIAEQCPTEGGPAVYRARTMVALINDTINFDDACIQVSSNRNSHTSSQGKVFPELTIIPNPAQNKISIVLSDKFSGVCKIQIINSLGSDVLNEYRNCNQKSISVNTSSLLPGVYTVKVQIEENFEGISKLIIVR